MLSVQSVMSRGAKHTWMQTVWFLNHHTGFSTSSWLTELNAVSVCKGWNEFTVLGDLNSWASENERLWTSRWKHVMFIPCLARCFLNEPTYSTTTKTWVTELLDFLFLYHFPSPSVPPPCVFFPLGWYGLMLEVWLQKGVERHQWGNACLTLTFMKSSVTFTEYISDWALTL